MRFYRPGALFVQNNTQQGFVDLKTAVVLDVSHLFEFIHEEINPGTRRPYRVCQRFLRYLTENPLGLVVHSIPGKQQKSAGEPVSP